MLPPKSPPAPVAATPAVVNHVFKAGLLGGAGALFVYLFAVILVTVMHQREDDWVGFLGLGVGLLLLGMLLILGGLRHIFTVVAQPSLRLSADGIESCIPSRKLFPGLFLPRPRMQRATISWADFLGTQTYTQSVNFVPVTRELWIKSRQGILKVDGSLFAGSPQRLQTWLLDYYEDVRRSGAEA